MDLIDKYLGESDKRWAYGTKDKKWHLVSSDDRDFKSGINQKEFKKIGKDAARKKYLKLQEKVGFPSGRTAYTPDDIIKVIKANKKYQGKTGKVIQNLIDRKDQKVYHIEVEVDGKRIVLKNTEVEMVKARKL